ncbi:MAG: DUF3310 domain-containing protein [Proteobacteria bacterium]|nr:DUF3310 domain-containing protein [Pseudomonadota bacterium]
MSEKFTKNSYNSANTDVLNLGAPVAAQDFWEEDGISLTGNPYHSPDQIVFTGSGVLGGLGNDHISLNPSSTFNLTVPEDTNKNGFWKYEEDKTLKEVESYLSSTYHSHYTSETSKTQTLDLIESIGDAEAFTRSNAIKYLSRFGKKNGKSKQDILKAIHYCVLLYHFAGLHKNNSNNYPY